MRAPSLVATLAVVPVLIFGAVSPVAAQGEDSYSGVLSTDGDLVFLGEDSDAFAAFDAYTGEPLWHFQANQDWKASPMTYMVAGRQYVAIASGLGFWTFALQE